MGGEQLLVDDQLVQGGLQSLPLAAEVGRGRLKAGRGRLERRPGRVGQQSRAGAETVQETPVLRLVRLTRL